MGGVQPVTQLGEGVAAGELHLQNPGLDGLGDGVGRRSGALPQGEGHGLQLLRGGDQLLQVAQAPHIAAEGGAEQPHIVAHHVQLVVILGGHGVARVHRQRQLREQEQPLQQRVQLLLTVHQLLQPGQFVHIGGEERVQGFHLARHLRHVSQEGLVLKALVQVRQIPCPVHASFLHAM